MSNVSPLRSVWTCPMCRRGFNSSMAKARHYGNFFKGEDDPTRCDKLARSATINSPANLTTLGATSPSLSDSPANLTSPSLLDSPTSKDSLSDASESVMDAPVITTPVITTPLWELARRPAKSQDQERRERCISYTLRDAVVPATMMPRDMVHVMHRWKVFQNEVFACASERFWRFFLALHTQPGVAIDAALQAAKSEFMSEEKGSQAWSQFPRNRRLLLQRISKVPFWSHVMHNNRIDLRSFSLPGIDHVDFKFIDPFFGWVIAAQQQRADDMHWKPAPCFTASGVPLYGGGIQQGLSFARACRSCPPGAYPMCISLHWDGTAARGLNTAPICVGVVNTNNQSVDTQFCLLHCPSWVNHSRDRPTSPRLNFISGNKLWVQFCKC